MKIETNDLNQNEIDGEITFFFNIEQEQALWLNAECPYRI